MGAAEMEEVASLLADALFRGRGISPDVHRLRARFPDVGYGFTAADLGDANGSV
jgi:hypothetical protein